MQIETGMVRPDYDGACITGIVPALLERGSPAWMPSTVGGASTVVLFVLDGLGADVLEKYADLLPNMRSFESRTITSVVPSSTASALPSLTTGLTPSEHGIVGYRMKVGPEVLNVLGWFRPGGGPPPDPAEAQPAPAFLGHQIKVVTRSQFLKSGFSEAHMRGARIIGWNVTSTMIEHCRRLAASGEPLVYAYYDGIDVVAHRYGLQNEFFLEELKEADRLVGALLAALPSDAALLVASDHGQVHIGRKGWVGLEPCDPYVQTYAGDGRFRLLYARAGAAMDLRKAAEQQFGDRAWVFTREQLIEEGWFGPPPQSWVAERISDVVLAARDPVAFIDPTNPLEVNLLSGHGSITDDEMLVPLLAARGGRSG
ncbi:MAG: alkaline phosphatase family protein [Actinomycetota bacterium]